MSHEIRCEIKPYRQGALDHWCGLYAIVNAIHLLAGPYEDSACVDLFAELQRELLKLRTGRLTARIEYGVTQQEMKALLNGFADEFGLGVRTLRRDVGKARVATLFSYWRSLQCYFERANGYAAAQVDYSGHERGIAVLYVGGSLRHWTVVHAVTNRHLRLFDSCGMTQLARKKMVLKKRTRGRSRIINGASTFLVYLRD